MKISISLNEESIQSAISKVEEYKKTYRKKIDEFLLKLAEIGYEIEYITYLSADLPLDNDIKVYPPQKIENGYKITANGKDICFVEFGTGVYAGDAGGYDTKEIPEQIEARPGSWSDTHAGVFSKHGFWHYKKVLFYGTKPAMGFYYAKKEMCDKIIETAREVFGNDRYREYRY